MAIEARVKQDLSLVRALYFMWKHGSDMTFEVGPPSEEGRNDGALLIGPAALARRHADEIRGFRSAMVTLLETTWWSPSVAGDLFTQAIIACAHMKRGLVPEVHQHADYEHPELNAAIEAVMADLDAAQHNRSMKHWNRAICRFLDAHAEMLSAYRKEEVQAA